MLSRHRSSESDPIEPVSIVHNVDEVGGGGGISERYNYLNYRFERDDVVVLARVYLYDLAGVSISPPATEPFPGGPHSSVEAPRFYDDVMLYLARRFRVISALTDEFGYQPVWIERRPRGWAPNAPWPPTFVDDESGLTVSLTLPR